MFNVKDIKKFLVNKEKTNLRSRLKEADEIIAKLKSLKNIWQKHKIEKIYLYGAFADMSFHKYSDIDIAVKGDMDYERFLQLYSQLNRLFKREVDARLLKDLPFEEKILKDGILIYERKNTYTKKRNLKRPEKAKQSFQ